MTTLLPGQTAPDLNLDLVGGGTFKLGDANPENFTMVVFYRGLHCPVCKTYARTMRDLAESYANVGIEIVLASMDTQKRATIAVDDWEVADLDVAYGLTEGCAKEWGLFISTAIKDGEPDRFSEPGLFLVRPDNTLYYSAVNSMPFGRPDPTTFLDQIGWALDKAYPARGQAT